MCWSATASIVAFIVGTILTWVVAFVMKCRLFYLIAIMWQWVLLMQLFEFILWKNPECNSTNEIATMGAYIANVLQPVICFILFMLYNDSNIPSRVVASILIVSYIIFLLITNKGYKCVTKTKTCSHLSYPWWNEYKGLFYVFILCSIVLLLIRPISLSIFMVLFLIVSISLSARYYSCGIASMWCFFAIIAPILFALFYKYK